MKRFIVLLFVSLCFAQPGVIKDDPGTAVALPQSQAIGSMADWYSCDTSSNTDYSGFVTASKWGSHWQLKGFYNNSGSVAVIRFSTVVTPAKSKFIKLAAYSYSGKLPEIYQVISFGATDTLLYLLQYR